MQSYNDLMSAHTTSVRSGTLVFIYGMQGVEEYVVGNIVRLEGIAVLAAAFFIFLLIFGKLKGLATILSLTFSVLAVFLVFMPAILSGRNIYVWTAAVCAFTIVINPLFVGGFNSKSYASQLGCFGGVAIAGALALAMNSALRITGIVDDDSMLLSSMIDLNIDMKAIVFSMVLIGALGAAIDVSMSISTSVYEMSETALDTRFGALFKSGLNIGRDIMGAQTGTLVLAYIGSSLSIVLLLVAYQSSILELLNIEMIIIELLQALIGGFTILFTIPATALFGAAMFARKKAAPSQRRTDESNAAGAAERPAAAPIYRE